MINPSFIMSEVLKRPGLVTQPFWQQVVLQLAFVSIAGLLAGRLFIGDVWQAVNRIEEQTVQVRLSVQTIQKKLDAMPLLSVLRTQFAEKSVQAAPVQPDRLAPLIAKPLSLAGASLLSWQPVPRQAGEAHQERWQLAFSADYTGILQVLRELTALPYVLRIAQLTIKPDAAPMAPSSRMRQLQVELVLLGPEKAP